MGKVRGIESWRRAPFYRFNSIFRKYRKRRKYQLVLRSAIIQAVTTGSGSGWNLLEA